MKKIIYICCLVTIFSCNSEDAGDCIQTAGTIIKQEIEVAPFTRILVNKKIALVISEGPTQKVIVETGKNLMPDIEVQVIDNQMILTNHNSCNYFRDYGITKVYITAPDISEIRNASELNVTSEGLLTFPNLFLESTGIGNTFLAVGDFDLNIDNSKVTVLSNGISNFYLSGKTKELTIYFASGDTRLEGKNLISEDVTILQVSSNDILIHPTNSLKGSIHSVGNVISFNKPSIVEVDVQSKG
ncbi:head GIN domain-containing protein, partial [Lutibacter sp.]|uniref:head GIN domain-containing protein n=1 Tax=Lutibacter sp. TaxID=1925666 RepID=UPI0034A00091